MLLILMSFSYQQPFPIQPLEEAALPKDNGRAKTKNYLPGCNMETLQPEALWYNEKSDDHHRAQEGPGDVIDLDPKESSHRKEMDANNEHRNRQE